MAQPGNPFGDNYRLVGWHGTKDLDWSNKKQAFEQLLKFQKGKPKAYQPQLGIGLYTDKDINVARGFGKGGGVYEVWCKDFNKLKGFMWNEDGVMRDHDQDVNWVSAKHEYAPPPDINGGQKIKSTQIKFNENAFPYLEFKKIQ